MSYLLVDRVLAVANLEALPKLVLAQFARYANDDGSRAYPAIATVAALVCRTSKQTRRIVQQLVWDGWMTERHGGGGRRPDTASGHRRGATTEYQINVDKLMLTLPPMGVLGTTDDALTLPSEASNPPINGANPPISMPLTLPPMGADSVLDSVLDSFDKTSVDIALTPILKEVVQHLTPTPTPTPKPKRLSREEQLAHVTAQSTPEEIAEAQRRYREMARSRALRQRKERSE